MNDPDQRGTAVHLESGRKLARPGAAAPRRAARAIAVLLGGLASPVLAATFTVNSTTDAVDAAPGNGVCATSGGVCTLRAAIQEANALAGADTITLPAGTYTLGLNGAAENGSATGDLDLNSNVTISGAGAATTTVNAAGIDRVLENVSGTSTVSGVTLTGGNSGSASGGGVLVTAGSLTLSGVKVTVSTTTSNGGGIFNAATLVLIDAEVGGNNPGGNGGGIANTGGLTITRSLIAGNSGTNGGGIDHSGAGATLTITNVTISGNSATSSGGGLVVSRDSSLINVTVTLNSAPSGGSGIEKSGSGSAALLNTIVSGNLGAPNCGFNVGDLGNNLDSAASCGFPAGNSNKNPLLGPLQDNGGPTRTHALQSGSPAIDAGAAGGAPSDDQRGVSRPQGPGYDIGAFELVTYSVSGTVFEDANYGGGAGRSLAASSGAVRPGARVELFNAAGTYVTFTTTDAGGNYSFAGLATASYTVRVVNSSVTSSRPNAVAGLLPVQTFRTDAVSGAAVADVNRVGGEDPTKVDAGNGSTTLAALTSGTTTAQSIAPVTLGTSNITGVDFGFNFDTIVSTRDAGQGSLREFLTNSNTLGNAGLAQVGQAAGVEASLFMIPDGLAHPGLRAGLTNQLTAGGVAEISLASLLPSITDAATRIDGTTQTTNVGNTNTAVLGAGGTVGVDALTLSQVAGPEVSIRDGASLATGLRLAANDATVRGLAIRGFGAADGEGGIRIDNNFTGALIENNVLGSTATSFVDPGAAERGRCGVHVEGGDGGTIRDNLIGFHDVRGIFLVGAATGWTIQGNEIRDSGQATDDGDGIAINASSTNAVTGNLIVGSSSQGYVVNNGASGNTFTNNTVTGNGVGTPTTLTQSAAVTMRTTAAGTLLDRNIIRLNHGAGIQVNNGAGTTRLTRNSFADNGTITAHNGGGPTGQVGIDLNAAGEDANLGAWPFRTLNDSGDGDAGGNGLLNFPILTSASLSGGNLTLQGYARPGSLIELFVAAADPSGFGEGQTYKITLTEGGTGAGGNDPYADTDATTGTYGPGAINGIAQGTDTTNRFTFAFPVPPGVTDGTLLTSTATLAGETSEFGGNVAVANTYSISGTVFEDADFTGSAANYDGGGADLGLPNVDVELYDGGTDAYIASTTTVPGGTFAFGLLANGTYKVRARSATIGDADTPPKGALNATVPATWPYPLAEMTWANGAASYGGQSAVVDDTATGDNAGPGDTYVAVSVSGASLTGVNLGFAYNLIVNTSDDLNGDAARSAQGSLRQFIKNANAIGSAGGTTANSSQFRLQVATNQVSGADSWWRIATPVALPPIDDGGTVLDGTTQTVNGGNTNSLGPEIEIVGTGALNGINLTSAGNTVRGLAASGYDGNPDFAAVAINGAAATGNTVAGNYLGTTATGTAAAATRNYQGVAINGASGNTIGGLMAADRNVLSGNRWNGVRIKYAGASANTILGNYIGTDATGTAAVPNQIGVYVWDVPNNVIGGTTAAAANVCSGNAQVGVFVFDAGSSGTVVQGNTIGLNAAGSAALPNTFAGVQLASAIGARVGGMAAGAGNVIASNGNHGVVVNGLSPTGNAIVSNSIRANVGLGIDLDGDGITPNDAGDADGGANELLNFPVLDWAVAASPTLSVGFDLDVPAGSYRIEFFKNPSGADPSGYGEGQTFASAVNLTHVGGGPQRFTHSFPGTAGDVLTATTTVCADGAACTALGSTSEFGPALTVTTLAVVKRAFRADGTPIASGVVLPRGTPVKFLLYVNNPGALASDVSLRDVLDPAFAYVAGSLRFAGTTPACVQLACTAGEEAAIFAAADAGTAGTDAEDGDVVSFAGQTVDTGDQNAANLQLDVPAARVFALVFTVRMQ